MRTWGSADMELDDLECGCLRDGRACKAALWRRQHWNPVETGAQSCTRDGRSCS